MNFGIQRLPLRSIEQMLNLNLPDGHRIRSVEPASGGIDVFIEGPTMPEVENGALIPFVDISYDYDCLTGKTAIKEVVVIKDSQLFGP